MYLANDVIQNSKKKGPEFGKEFETVLPKAFEHMKGFDEKTRERLNRLLQIWEERGVYDKAQIAEFKAAFLDTIKDPGTPPPKKKPKIDLDKVTTNYVHYYYRNYLKDILHCTLLYFLEGKKGEEEIRD